MILMTSILASQLLFSFEDPTWEQASLSAYAIDSKTGRVILDQNGHKSLTPASCMKLVTTAAALHILGPDFCFQTDLEYDGKIDPSGILKGNLYIHGRGDPCLGSGRISPSPDWSAQADLWADEIAKLGIRAIEGRVIGDASDWEDALAVPSWNWEDLGNYYGAGACALSFHENAYTLTFKPGAAPGEKTSIVSIEPPLPNVKLRNEAITGERGSGDLACIYGAEFTDVQTVRGTIPAGVNAFSIRGAIPNPPSFCASVLARALENRGIRIKNSTLEETSQRKMFYSTRSPALWAIVRETNRLSLNLYAEHLLKKIGEVVCNQGSTQAGVLAVTQFLKDQEIDLKGFHLADGSGLSRQNMITAKQLVALLSVMKRSDRFKEYFSSLPEIDSGVRAKGGSMSFVRAYAGYAGDGIFAVIVNQCKDPQARAKIRAMISQFSAIGRRESGNAIEAVEMLGSDHLVP